MSNKKKSMRFRLGVVVGIGIMLSLMPAFLSSYCYSVKICPGGRTILCDTISGCKDESCAVLEEYILCVCDSHYTVVACSLNPKQPPSPKG
jgi:hypothetical protein